MRRKRNIYLIILIMVMAMVSSIGYAALSQDLSISGDIAYEKKERFLCKRATRLHAETCSRTSSGCRDAGYYSNGSKNTTTITYGSLGINDTTLTSGDAFDCDVNGDGIYDSATERFYYVSGLDGDNNSDYAVLIYYTNVSAGEANNASRFFYNSDRNNSLGPTTAYLQLPTPEETQWKNVNLSNQTRQIYAENNTTSTIDGILSQFTYENRAARLLSHKEVNAACGITIGNKTEGELDSCEYLLEHTSYSTSSTSINSAYWWLESPSLSDSRYVWNIYGYGRNVVNSDVGSYGGVRPAIEIEKSQMDLSVFVPKCKRATTLHTEECDRTDNGCYAAGYYSWGQKKTSTITYGSLGSPETLTSGDAFDCDVNGDGTYDPESERFYYVSGLDGDDTSDYATLIYYTNVSAGEPNNTAIFAYDSSSYNYYGPRTAYLQLPSASQWSNVSLSNQTRQIYSHKGTTSTSGGSLPQFTYTDRVARLLSYKEVDAGCEITYTTGELDSCEYLLEHTDYSTSRTYVNASYWWLESPYSSDTFYVWYISGAGRALSTGSYASITHGIRPAIEVLKSDILY